LLGRKAQESQLAVMVRRQVMVPLQVLHQVRLQVQLVQVLWLLAPAHQVLGLGLAALG